MHFHNGLPQGRETPLLFLEGSTGVEATANAATVTLPDASVARAGTSAARAGTSVACATSSVDRPVAGASAPAPGASSSAASAALGEGGVGSHLSGGACPPSLSSSSSSSDSEYSDVAGGESPCCSRRRNSSSLHSRRSHRRIPRSFLRAARSCSRRCAARARSGSGRGRVGPRGVHGHPLLGRRKRQSHVGIWRKGKGKGGGESPLTSGPSGSITNDQRSSLLFLTALSLMVRLALVAAYS
jgi:hypothetical protein